MYDEMKRGVAEKRRVSSYSGVASMSRQVVCESVDTSETLTPSNQACSANVTCLRRQGGAARGVT